MAGRFTNGLGKERGRLNSVRIPQLLPSLPFGVSLGKIEKVQKLLGAGKREEDYLQMLMNNISKGVPDNGIMYSVCMTI